MNNGNTKKRKLEERDDDSLRDKSLEEEEPVNKLRRTKLFDIQDDDDEDFDENRIENDPETGERYAFVKIQGGLKRVPLDRPVRVYADGIYDLFHFGHARSLRQAKTLFPNTCLVVGVCGDAITNQMKGRTVMTESERVECVSHCRYVDEVVPLAPWVVTKEFIKEHKIDFITHGEDVSLDENGQDVYKEIKEMGKFLTIKRTEGISTTDLILRIVKDYDKYVRRNLKRGLTCKEMNIGFVKEKSIQFMDKVEELKNGFKHWAHSADEALHSFLQLFSDQSNTDRLARTPVTPLGATSSFSHQLVTMKDQEFDSDDDDDDEYKVVESPNTTSSPTSSKEVIRLSGRNSSSVAEEARRTTTA